MLTAAALAALESSTPPTRRPRREDDDSASLSSSGTSVEDDGTSPAKTSTTSTTSTLPPPVGATRSERAKGTDASYDAAEKWILAALRTLGKSPEDLLLPSHEPDDALVSKVHATIAQWRVTGTTAASAGVVDHRPYELTKIPPQCVLAKARGWFIRHVNRERAKHGVREVDAAWARKLAGVKADAREVNVDARDGKARNGKLYHHKHDLAPSYEAVTAMCAIAFTGDARVDHSLLDACEAGMSLAIYFPTGARGSELKNMHLQSIGYEEIAHEASGEIFHCIKLTAFECKTKEQHLNQFLASSNPWRCGIGGLGVSILLRVQTDGPPPLSMQLDDDSWKIIGTSVGRSFERRLNDAFSIAGVRRQVGDPLTYLGRHFGTRTLQHQGGSTEGGAARRGHSSGTTFSYSECPLPDLLRLMGNDPVRPFVPAHLKATLFPFADAVLAILFPQLAEWRRALAKRHAEVDASGGKAVRMRSDEQLNDKERVLNGIEYSCRVALLCLVARPRTWRKWAIAEDMPTMWQQGTANRVVHALFAQNAAAIEAMNDLALQVRRCEESELVARQTSPGEAVSNAVVAAVQDLSNRQTQREEELFRQQARMYEVLMTHVAPSTAMTASNDLSSLTAAALAPLPLAENVATHLMRAPSTNPLTVEPLPGARVKRKPQAQHDVAHFSSHPSLRSAFEYARDDLYPMEREEGAAWRIKKLDEKREDKSRDRQWRFYRQLVIAVGLKAACENINVDAAIAALEKEREHYKSITAFNNALLAAQKDVKNGDAIVKRLLSKDAP